MSSSDRQRDVSIPDVARAAGVSPATAARALGGYGRVSKTTRAHVLQVAETLQYSANSVARSMVTGRTDTLGAIIADIEDPFFSRAVRGFADGAKEHGYDVILVNTDELVEAEVAALRVLLEKRVDGIMVAPASMQRYDHLLRAHQDGLPLVLIDRRLPETFADVVEVDNHDASYRATMRLIRNGHTAIAAPHGALPAHRGSTDATNATNATNDMISTTIDRLAGFRAAMRDAGLEVAERYVPFVDGSREAIAAGTVELLRDPDRPSALFAIDDLFMLGILDAVHAVRLRIPEDVSVIGFDDTKWTTALVPNLSVISQPVYEMGRRAADCLAARIANPSSPPRIHTLKTTWIERESIAVPHLDSASR